MLSFQGFDGLPAEQERNTPDDSKAAVDETPCKWYASDVAGDESERQDTRTRNQPKSDDPAIADGVEVRTNKYDGDHKVSER